MKVIGVSGSPRKNGNTAYLVRAALTEMEKYDVEAVLIHLCEYAIGDCRGCEGCRESYRCVVRDDMQKLYPLLDEADALILGSPTYFYDVTALMKAFLDRLYCYEVFDEDDRSVWMSVNEARGGQAGRRPQRLRAGTGRGYGIRGQDHGPDAWVPGIPGGGQRADHQSIRQR